MQNEAREVTVSDFSELEKSHLQSIMLIMLLYWLRDKTDCLRSMFDNGIPRSMLQESLPAIDKQLHEISKQHSLLKELK